MGYKEGGRDQMKRTIILIMVLAIAVSLAVVSFAMYNQSLALPTSTVATKLYDLFSATPKSVTESQYAENAPSWNFMTFNTSTESSDFDLVVEVTLDTIPLSGLQVALLDESDTTLASAAFSGDTAILTVLTFIPSNTTGSDHLHLEFTYGGSPLSPTNRPFDAASVHYTVSAYGQLSEDLISQIMDNCWCSSHIHPTGNKRTEFSFYLDGISAGPDNINKSRVGTLLLEYSASTGILTVSYAGSSTSITTSDPSGYVSPDAVVIHNDGFNASDFLIINSVDLNGTVYTGPYLADGTPQEVLFTGLTTDLDGSFYVSIEYSMRDGFYSGTSPFIFGVYVGYQ